MFRIPSRDSNQVPEIMWSLVGRMCWFIEIPIVPVGLLYVSGPYPCPDTGDTQVFS